MSPADRLLIAFVDAFSAKDGHAVLRARGGSPVYVHVVPAGFDPSKLRDRHIVVPVRHHHRSEDSQERYQGIVQLEGGSVAPALEHYFAQSAQLETPLARGRPRAGGRHAAAEDVAGGAHLEVRP